jgi:phospholipid/cholesterol/gamma-HCH transport system permease protein
VCQRGGSPAPPDFGTLNADKTVAVMLFYASILVLAIAAGGMAGNRPALASEARNLSSAAASGAVRFFEWFGELGAFCGRVARAAFTRPFEFRELLRQMDSIGAVSLPLVAAAGAAVGVVLSLQTRASLARFGAKSMLPTVVIFSLIKETGPIITALVVSGRVAAGIGAELGSMKVTEQIDAMEASAIDPYKYLVATRVVACILMLPLLTVAADFCGVFMGWVSQTLAEPISLRLFINSGLNGVMFDDFFPPTLKTAVFGAIMGLVASFQGMRTTGGTAGVGRATTSAVVISSLLIIVADVVLVRLILVFFP